MNELRILSVNIDGVYDKLENIECIKYLSLYDIVYIFELKCTQSTNVPGFKTLRSSLIKGEELRGGTSVLIKHALWQSLFNVRRYKDQVWFSLSCVPCYRFGAVYIPPADSPFYTPESFAFIREELIAHLRCIFSGDINARVPDLSNHFDSASHGISYERNVDSGSNMLAKELTSLCKECHVVPVNHLKYCENSFPGNLTYRKSNNWISQLDWLLCDIRSLPCVKNFAIIQSMCIPTDHAALSYTLKFPLPGEAIHTRSKDLGKSLMPKPPRKPILSMNDIDKATFVRELPNPSDFWQQMHDTESATQYVTSHMYSTALAARVKKTPPVYQAISRDANNRWNNVLQSGDSRGLWKAIDWNGSFCSTPDEINCPPDEEFCRFYTELLNDREPTPLSVPVTNNSIQELDCDIEPHEIDICIKQLKADKAAGIDGVPPGVFKYLSDEWILVLTFVFNLVFNGIYPLE